MLWSLIAGLAAVVLALVAAIVLALCLPWFVSLAARTAPQAGFRLELRPFGPRFPALLRLRGLSWPRGPRPAEETGVAPAPPATRRHRRGAAGRRLTPRLLHHAPVLLGGLRAVFRIERLVLSGRVGLPDPADTGQLFGVILPLSHACPSDRVAIAVEPVFDGPAFEAEAEARLRVQPIRLLPSVVRFGWRVFVRPA
ncbi:MAG: DUF2953 domain-containing protein [Rhodobacteraceae bacterium]|nr:DUF2953 domain-containing protein [Paracoccaceae bacterium]